MVRVLPRARLAGPALCLVLLVAGCSDDAPAPGATGATTGAATGSAAAPATGSPSAPAKGTKKGSAAAPPVDTATPAVAISTAPAVDVGTTTTLSNGVKVLVSKVSVVKVKASGPGDIAGDGVAVHLTVKNSSTKPFDLNGIAVTASYGKAQPASPGGAGTGTLLTGNLKVGQKARGVYVFTVPKAKAGTVEIQVSSNASALILVYKK
jgi:hypothetical protein